MSRRTTTTTTRTPTPTATPTAGWDWTSASVRGASHDRNGLPNQDAVLVRRAKVPAGTVVAAVADGHGGARYVRSDIGSRLAVEITCDVGAEVVAELDRARRRDGAAMARRLTAAVVERWTSAVLEHVASHPFTVEERERAGAPLDAEPLVAYGCTLVSALLAPTWLALVQVGDGDALVVADDGRVDEPVPGDDRLVGGETTSLCLPTAVDDARGALLEGDLPALVVLSSDGYGNSFADPAWRTDAGRGLLDAVRRDGLDGVAERLPRWLADSAAAGGDDVTMVLATRARPDVPTAPAPAAPPAGAPGGAGGRTGHTRALEPSPRSPRRRARPALLAGVAAVALAVGAIGGWTIGQARGDDSTPPAADPTVVTTPAQDPLPEEAVRPVSMVLDDRVVTFTPVLTDGAVRPTATFEGPVGVVVPEDDRVRIDGFGVLVTTDEGRSQRLVTDRPVATFQIVDEHIWLASDDGEVRPYGFDGSPLLDRWQPVVEAPTE